MANVLCLHGCGQTSETFRQILGNLIKIGEKEHDFRFFFLEAEYPRQDGKQWFDQDLSITDIGKMRYPVKTVQITLMRIHKFILENDIKILLGFSQGGNVVHTYLNYFPEPFPNIRCAVIFSGYHFLSDKLEINDIPLLNIFSESDEIVNPKFRPGNHIVTKEMIHDKGHKMPTSKPFLREILKWINNMSS